MRVISYLARMATKCCSTSVCLLLPSWLHDLYWPPFQLKRVHGKPNEKKGKGKRATQAAWIVWQTWNNRWTYMACCSSGGTICEVAVNLTFSNDLNCHCFCKASIIMYPKSCLYRWILSKRRSNTLLDGFRQDFIFFYFFFWTDYDFVLMRNDGYLRVFLLTQLVTDIIN